MIPTPFLKGFNTEGGTLYVFPSVSKDLTRTLVSNDYEFKFSHFACLNLPDIYTGVYGGDSDSDSEIDYEKGLYLGTLAPDDWVANEGRLGDAIAENLQNYVMNFETAILNGQGDDDEYDNDILTTVSEKVFWNWLQKIGGIRFAESGNIESYPNYAERTVQYIGNLDVMNTVEINGDSFEELYIHIPSSVGASTQVYFRKGELTDNKNYLNKNYPLSYQNSEYIIGRYGQEQPFGLSTKSFVDIDDGDNIYTGDEGHTIDFRDSSYAGGNGINAMNSESLEDFEFNAILIYYDIYQKTSVSNVKKVATNLYGILFLDDVKSNNYSYFITRYPKKKESVYGNGNGYALKIDLKVDTIGDTSYQYVSVDQPNSPEGMALYVKALSQLQKCIDFFFTQKLELVKLSNRVATLENMVMGIDSISSLRQDINKLYDRYDNNSIVDTAAILGLVDANSKKLNSILNGEKDIKLQFDADVIQPGTGIGIKKTSDSVIISSEQKYAISPVVDGNSPDEMEFTSENPMKTGLTTSKICNLELQPGENLAVIYVTDTGYCTTNININVNTENYQWVVGQSFKIFFKCDDGALVFDSPDTKALIVKPNANSILTIYGSELEGNDLVEIICVGEDKFIYLIK